MQFGLRHPIRRPAAGGGLDHARFDRHNVYGQELLLLASYVAVFVLAAAILLLASVPILVKGRAVFLLILTFVLIAGGLELAGTRFAIGPWLALSAVALVAGWVIRDSWLLVHVTRDGAAAMIEASFSRLLVTVTREGRRYTLEPPARPASLIAIALSSGLAVLIFGGDWHQNKARLARAYLAKQFRGVLPPLVIRLPR